MNPAEETASHDEVGAGLVDLTKVALGREPLLETHCDIKDLQTDYFCGNVQLRVEMQKQ